MKYTLLVVENVDIVDIGGTLETIHTVDTIFTVHTVDFSKPAQFRLLIVDAHIPNLFSNSGDIIRRCNSRSCHKCILKVGPWLSKS